VAPLGNDEFTGEHSITPIKLQAETHLRAGVHASSAGAATLGAMKVTRGANALQTGAPG
jgi:hypothetical protein